MKVEKAKFWVEILKRLGMYEVGLKDVRVRSVEESYHRNSPPLFAQTCASTSTVSGKDCVCSDKRHGISNDVSLFACHKFRSLLLSFHAAKIHVSCESPKFFSVFPFV